MLTGRMFEKLRIAYQLTKSVSRFGLSDYVRNLNLILLASSWQKILDRRFGDYAIRDSLSSALDTNRNLTDTRSRVPILMYSNQARCAVAPFKARD